MESYFFEEQRSLGTLATIANCLGCAGQLNLGSREPAPSNISITTPTTQPGIARHGNICASEQRRRCNSVVSPDHDRCNGATALFALQS
jgi:hypothetical protein